MLRSRIIPCLLVHKNGLVKTNQFKDPKYVGDPINAVKIFNEKEVDELVVLDIYASKQNRDPNFERIKRIATECFMPLAYGGGIKTLSHIKKAFAQGIEKIIICSAGDDFELIKSASKIYGHQSIVVCVDIKKSFLGKFQILKESGTKIIKLSIEDYVKSLTEAGVGEIILQFINFDGEMKGYNLDLIKKVSAMTNVPVVALGGAGQLEDFRLAINEGASAVASGSLFVFKGKHKGILINYPTQKKLKEILK